MVSMKAETPWEETRDSTKSEMRPPTNSNTNMKKMDTKSKAEAEIMLEAQQQDKLRLLAAMALKTEAQHPKVGSCAERQVVNLLSGCSPCIAPPSLQNVIDHGPPKEILIVRQDNELDGMDHRLSKTRYVSTEDKEQSASAPRSHLQNKKRKITSELPTIISNEEDDPSVDSSRRSSQSIERPSKLAKGVYFHEAPQPTNKDFMLARKYTRAGSFTAKSIPLVHPALLRNGNGIMNANLKPLCMELEAYDGGVSCN